MCVSVSVSISVFVCLCASHILSHILSRIPQSAEAQLTALRQKALAVKERSLAPNGIPFTEDKQVDYTKDFFKRAAYLTVSGQLQGETYACSLGNIYTFGPTFRAENSNTTRHLAEFWMIEPEMAFVDINGCMDVGFILFCVVQRNNRGGFGGLH